MKLTKYEHSCVVLEKDGASLVIDPGQLSDSFVVPENCVGVVVTHEHFDHLDQSKLQTIIDAYSSVQIIANNAVIALLNEKLKERAVVVEAGKTMKVGEFRLEFVGGTHEQVRPELPACTNTGIIIDEVFYHPGDAYFVPEKRVLWLAVPLNAPWSRVSETCEFIRSIRPQSALSIHDGLLNEAGINTYKAHISAVCEDVGSQFHVLKSGEQIELDNKD